MNCYQLRFEPFSRSSMARSSEMRPATRSQTNSKLMTRYTSNQQLQPNTLNANFKQKYASQVDKPIYYPRLHKQSELQFGLLKESRRRLQKTLFFGMTNDHSRGAVGSSKDIRYLRMDDSGVRLEDVQQVMHPSFHRHPRLSSDLPLHKIFREKNIEPYLRKHKKDKSSQIEFTNEALIKVTEL